MLTGLILLVIFVMTIWAIWRDPKARPLLTLTAVILTGGTIFYHNIEGWSLLDSLYFCVITLATIGYGDFAPQTDAGKAFTILYIFVGFGVLASFIRLIAQRESLRRGARRRSWLDMLFGDDDDDDDDRKAPKRAKSAPAPAPSSTPDVFVEEMAPPASSAPSSVPSSPPPELPPS